MTAYLQRQRRQRSGSASAPLDGLAPERRSSPALPAAGADGRHAGGAEPRLLGILTAAEDNRKTKVISAPVVIATDSIPATYQRGPGQCPRSASQAVTGVQSGGSSLFANTISTRSSGVTLKHYGARQPQRYRDHGGRPGGEHADGARGREAPSSHRPSPRAT